MIRKSQNKGSEESKPSRSDPLFDSSLKETLQPAGNSYH